MSDRDVPVTRSGNRMSNFYIKARRRLPSGVVSTLKKSSAASALARKLQPGKGGGTYRLEAPLGGYRMSLTGPNIYSMVWGEYEPAVCDVMKKVVKPGWTAADVGAHVGYHSLLLARLVSGTGKVMSFEPLPQNVRLLEENVLLNGLQDIVFIEPAAVMEESGEVLLQQAPNCFQAFVTEEAAEQSASIMVPAVSIDDHLRRLDWPLLHFVKMDVEGAESSAIAGMRETVERFKPVFLVEAHGEAAREGLEQLLSAGYKTLAICEDGTLLPHELADGNIGHEHWLLKP